MRISDLLTSNKLSELSELSNGIKHQRQNKKRYRRNSEHLSERDIKELMNTNIQRYKRVHGRVRGK